MEDFVRVAIVAVAALLATTGGLHAEIRGAAGVTVEESDLPLIERAALRLYKPGVEIGSVERWSNPESGNSGSVTLGGRLDDGGVPCWRTVHDVTVKGTTYRIDAQRCLVLPSAAPAARPARR